MKKQTKEEYKQLGETARELIKAICGLGYSCKDIEQHMDGRVTYRTLYRWMNGDSVPKRRTDVEALGRTYAKLKKQQ